MLVSCIKCMRVVYIIYTYIFILPKGERVGDQSMHFADHVTINMQIICRRPHGGLKSQTLKQRIIN